MPQLESPYAVAPSELENRPLYLTVSPDIIELEKGKERQQLPEGVWFVPILAAPSSYVSWLGGAPADAL